MRSIFLIVFLIPAVSATGIMDLLLFASEVQECINICDLEATKACSKFTSSRIEDKNGYIDMENEETKCYFHQVLMKAKDCMKPAVVKLLTNSADPDLVKKSVQNVFLCTLDLTLDKAEACFYVATKDWMEKNRIPEAEDAIVLIGAIGCTFEKVGSAFHECLTVQHKNAHDEF